MNHRGAGRRGPEPRDSLDWSGRLRKDRNYRAGSALVDTEKWESNVLFLERLLLHYGIYRRYPLKPWPAFKNAWRIAFR
jgi:hypothetical protein